MHTRAQLNSTRQRTEQRNHSTTKTDNSLRHLHERAVPVTVQTTKIDQLLENNTKTKALIEATSKKSFSTASKYMYKSYYKNHMYLKMKKKIYASLSYLQNECINSAPDDRTSRNGYTIQSTGTKGSRDINFPTKHYYELPVNRSLRLPLNRCSQRYRGSG